MKKNNGGFMLVELVIVSAVVILSMVSLYTGFNKVYIAYNERSRYYSIDCLYAGEAIKNLFIDEYRLVSIVNDVSTYKDVVSYCSVDDAFSNYCKAIYERYNIDSMYLVRYSKDNINSLKSYRSTDNSLGKYLDVFLKSSDNKDNDVYIIVKDKNDFFANVLVVGNDEIR